MNHTLSGTEHVYSNTNMHMEHIQLTPTLASPTHDCAEERARHIFELKRCAAPTWRAPLAVKAMPHGANESR